jgi:hypothetical protein
MKPEEVSILLAALLAGSEILATLPSIKANSWIQLVINILKRGVKG